MKIKNLTYLMVLVLGMTLCGCKKNNETIIYNEEENYIITADGYKFIQISEPWRLNSFTKKIGEITHKGENYKLFANDGDNTIYIELVKYPKNSERLNLFVREDVYLPKLEEITDYRVLYNDKGLSYNLLDYYDDSSTILIMEPPYSQIAVDIKSTKYNNIYYTIFLYQKDNRTYMPNKDGGYVLLPSSFIFE